MGHLTSRSWHEKPKTNKRTRTHWTSIENRWEMNFCFLVRKRHFDSDDRDLMRVENTHECACCVFVIFFPSTNLLWLFCHLTQIARSRTHAPHTFSEWNGIGRKNNQSAVINYRVENKNAENDIVQWRSRDWRCAANVLMLSINNKRPPLTHWDHWSAN